MSLGLFNLKSTYQEDFIQLPLDNIKDEENKKHDLLEKLPTVKKPIQVDLETMNKFHENVYVPFDLYFREKECVRKNPLAKSTEVIMEKKRAINKEKMLEVRKNRPRIFLTPQICLDDVSEDLMYSKNGLADNIYSSDWKRSVEIAQSDQFKPTQTYPPIVPLAQTNETIKPELFKYADDWDRFQLRSNVDLSKIFWQKHSQKLNRNIGGRMNLLSENEFKDIADCVKENNLRLPYQQTIPGYGGHIPQLPFGVSYKRKLFKKSEPWLSSNMLIYGEYEKK